MKVKVFNTNIGKLIQTTNLRYNITGIGGRGRKRADKVNLNELGQTSNPIPNLAAASGMGIGSKHPSPIYQRPIKELWILKKGQGKDL